MDDLTEMSFPESFTDCAGIRRQFNLEVRLAPSGCYVARAYEVTSSEHGGYIFTASSEGGAGLALARLRSKVWQGLAQRFLINDGTVVQLPFERIRGRISYDGVVVDGRLLSWDEFLKLLQPYEGWEFELRIPLEPDW